MAEPVGTQRVPNVRRRWLIGLWIANVLAIVAMAVGARLDIESVVGTGPALTLVGLALAVVARPLRSPMIVGFALFGPLICALVAGLISGFRLNPEEAQEPISKLVIVFAILAAPAALWALRRILRAQLRVGTGRDFTWRFSLRSLLLVTTAVCVLVALARAVVASNIGSEYAVFGLFNLVTLTLVALTVYAHCRTP